MLVIIAAFCGEAHAQTTRTMGLRDNTPGVFAFTNAEIVVEPGRHISGATLVVRNGIIEAVSRRVQIPADAAVIDLNGRFIYPGFIDMYSHYGLEDPEENDDQVHWNPQIRSHYSAAANFRPDAKQAGRMRSQGFVVAHSVPAHGLLRGQGSVVSLGEAEANRMIIRRDMSQALSFRRSPLFGRGYPTSAMGGIALLRQSMLDADWYVSAHNTYRANPGLERPETNLALEKLAGARQQGIPFIAETENENWVLRARAISGEFGLELWILGNGHEYKRIDEISRGGHPFILPLNFPSPPDVSTPEQALNVSLEDLRHWYLAPGNPAKVAGAGTTMALTSYGSQDKFLANLRTAIERGLDENAALAALTTTPAAMLGIDNTHGTLATGKAASFVISDKNLFTKESNILQVWVDGEHYPVKPDREEARGKWLLSGYDKLEGASIELEGQANRLRGHIRLDDKRTRLARVSYDNRRLMLGFPGDTLGIQGVVRMSASISGDQLLGIGETASGEFFTWKAGRTEGPAGDPSRNQRSLRPLDLPERFPSMEYGVTAIPEQPRHVVIRNATLWTQGPEGILEGADMLVENGRISAVGIGLTAPRRALEIDATGMHVTPGLIDPHIHSSIAGGVNEVGDAITSETRITDVMDANTVWIYRLLAGGITSATLFHGSANPIGGQNAVIKMRWGQLPDELLIEDAAPGLKMALGENVKGNTSRYPNTRQGVEQIIKDAFEAALEYGTAMEQAQHGQGKLPVRRDLTLEPILEVIRGERKAHVHAYRQDEMLMMIRLADEYGFTIGSFEHTLEGYKIADELREHGAGAVAWSDWSSFKVESYDGILHNARLLNDVGVLTSLHSDNTQLSTRMNWEAAKTMKTGVSEVDAMNFITLHPARIMGIDHRVGSLEVGKDADFVIWEGHPMSTFSIPAQTWVDGRKYFDRETDQALQQEVKQERAMIIARIIEEQQSAARNGQE